MSEINQEVEAQKTALLANEICSSMAPNATQPRILKGRRKIMTNYINSDQLRDGMTGYIVLNDDNIYDALREALNQHRDNASEIEYLMDYYKGVQDILYRKKVVRDDVDNRVVVNYASTFTRDIVGYTFGKPMQFIIRRNDSEEEGEKNPIKEELRTLIDYTELANKATSDQRKSTTASICGVAYRAIFMNKKYEKDNDESPFSYMDLNPENTFVAYSSQIGNEPVFACTFNKAGDNEVVYTIYTTTKVYVLKTSNLNRGVEKHDIVRGYPQDNPLGICIIECENNQFRMGHWETAITLMDAINKTASDSVNDVEQFVNSILVAINAEFTKESMENVKREKYAEIKSPQGLNADLKYISEQLDGGSVEQLRQYLEDCLRAVVGIPDRKTRGGGGGDTGDAVKLRDGWADMETVARTTEMFNKESERKELKIILKILKTLKLASKLSMINIDIKYPRNKTDNLLSKAQAMSTLYQTKMMAPEDVLEIGDITTDVQEVVGRGIKYWSKKEEELMKRNEGMATPLFNKGKDNQLGGGNVNGNKRQQPTTKLD